MAVLIAGGYLTEKNRLATWLIRLLPDYLAYGDHTQILKRNNPANGTARGHELQGSGTGSLINAAKRILALQSTSPFGAVYLSLWAKRTRNVQRTNQNRRAKLLNVTLWCIFTSLEMYLGIERIYL
jgi:hypothetical protein